MRENQLKGMMRELLDHKKHVDTFIKAYYQIHGIAEGDEREKNLEKILLPLIQARGGPKLDKLQVESCIRQFHKIYQKISAILPSRSGQDAVDYLVSQVKSISRIGPKITGVFLKDVVYHCRIWPELTDYLYLPIDRHVRDILTKRLGAFEDTETPGISESFFSKKNQEFQKVLAEIHTPRIEFDYLWFVGSHFCALRLACGPCWIRRYCQNRMGEL